MRPSYEKYKATLKDCLGKILAKEEGQNVLVDDVVKSVMRYLPDESITNQSQLIRQISLILGTKTERAGKTKNIV